MASKKTGRRPRPSAEPPANPFSYSGPPDGSLAREHPDGEIRVVGESPASPFNSSGASDGSPARGHPEGEIQVVGEAAVEYQAPLSFSLGPELSARLRLAAFARRWAPEVLAARLLMRGLDREPDRIRAEAAIDILTPRERDVTRLTALGKTNHEIAYELGIARETVKSHIRSTLAKLGLHSKLELRLLVEALDPWEERSDLQR